ncbi:HotDog domain-containing protein [Phascolomyces articulosus]|uniref:HotDog domain-containing protein n=1 Tax=Phascolomyces articulosus TaxID=60185 RepID=A0AAD5K4M8_9FUNG|nr:HotDog domain-containing protein [Phascolomyces articulosus]
MFRLLRQRSTFETAAKSIYRQSPWSNGIRQQRLFSSSSTSQSSFSFSKKYISTTLGCCILTGVAVYTTMSTQHATELFEQKQALQGAFDEHIEQAKAERDALDVVKAARESPDYFEVEVYGQLDIKAKAQSLTASTLRGKDKIIIPPVLFYYKDQTEVMAAVHLGKDLCGHAGIVHGGMCATLLDEILACVAMPALPNKIGFTANLNIDYRKPLAADQWVILRGKLDRAEGRKAYVKAWIESPDGKTKYSEATSLYISPKFPIAGA